MTAVKLCIHQRETIIRIGIKARKSPATSATQPAGGSLPRKLKYPQFKPNTPGIPEGARKRRTSSRPCRQAPRITQPYPPTDITNQS